jgi:S-adenosylmethionine decarboxylase proenzyme
MTGSDQRAGGRNVGTFGRHLLAEYVGCDPELLDDQERVATLLRQAAEAAGARVVGQIFQRFAPQGVSGVVVIEESHLSIHTWPEQGYAAVDFYTCGECEPERAHELLRAGLGARGAELVMMHRGRLAEPEQIRLFDHRREGRTPGEGNVR